MDFWTKEHIEKAIPTCKFYNFPENWAATGVRIWHEPLDEKDIVFVRSTGETRGAVKQNIIPLLPKISAIMCTNYDNFKDLDIPIIEVEDFTKAIFAMGRYIRRFYKGTVIALTGSAGKSTTTRMIYDVLEEYGTEANLNLANTLVAICWNMTTFDLNKKYWVIESSIGYGYAAFPNIAIVTNLAAVHLKAGQTIEGMAKGKSQIFATMRPGSYAILNREMECYEIFKEAALEKQLKILTVGERDGVDIKIIPEKSCLELKNRETLNINADYVPKHILYDMAEAICVAQILGLPLEQSLKKLENFKCLKGRGETLKLNYKNITLVDEAFNANPLSMPATIEAFGKNFSDNKVLFLGDMAEGGDKSQEYHLALVDVIKNASPKKVIFCGSEMKVVFDALQNSIDCQHFENIEKLLPEFKNFISENDNIFVKSSHSTGLHKIVEQLKKC